MAFILSSLILLFSASAFPFDTPWRMAFRIPYNLFPIVLATFFIMGTSLLAAAISASRCVFPRSMVCSRYPLPVLSAPSTGSSASSVHAAISAFPAWIRSSIYRCAATGSEFPLPDDDFQQEDADVHSEPPRESWRLNFLRKR
ncbi:hypothetical protein CP0169 (plasmid) [Shigella flexneri 2a str. 301]|uniref:Uncharacterized protein n=1 Tax=Shigella flexneri TaxID=623 RepID=A0A0H2UST7_SHIFL|nr:hypothetical protein [Shigella flexneri]NP_858302.2 hypothetical protein CP0169 [Shigella flexneri 2a str. 301]AAL72508.2 orf, hypothetical protein [Shigella flexneri 2a str. 301]